MPALAVAGYSIATINNSFDTDINPLVGLLDSHGMSLILSSSLLTFISHFGSDMSLISLLCMFIACLPFFFDGAMSIVSISRQRVLTAAQETPD